MSRSVRVLLAAVLALTAAGCAGQVDLSKTVTNRTTIKAASVFNDEALRLVQPCGLYTDEVINSIGKKKTSGLPDLTNYSECSYSVTDAATGKQDIKLQIKVGVDLLSAPKQFAKSVNGLGIYESRTSSGCTQTAVTGTKPDRGIVSQVIWDGGDMCAAASKLLEGSIRKIADKPPRYEDTAGSLVKLEPCAALDDATATTLLGGQAEKRPYGIRTCNYSWKTALVTVEYDIASDPNSANSTNTPTKVDLTDKVKGAAQFKNTVSPNACQVVWVHRALSGNRGENVTVGFQRTGTSGEPDDACAKSVEAAKAVATKLAKP